MSKETFYRQCKLQKKTTEGLMEQTSYIPEPYCVLNKTLKLREENGEWNDGWTVVHVNESRHSEKWTNEQSRAYTKNREATDI